MASTTTSTVTPQAPQIHPAWFAPPPYALPMPACAASAPVPFGEAVVKPPQTKTIKVNGEFCQKV